MSQQQVLERITDRAVLERHLSALAITDPRLEPVLEIAGDVPLRLGAVGFAGMVNIIVSQLLSVASANAIHGRVVELMGDVTAERFVALNETDVRACGLSGSKFRTMNIVAEAELNGELDYAKIPELPVDDAMAALTRLKGIGPWTAEIYLLFCVGHPDIFPAGDLVLRKMVGHTLGRKKIPDEKATRRLTKKWSPYRGAAARLMWRYFAVLKKREGINL